MKNNLKGRAAAETRQNIIETVGDGASLAEACRQAGISRRTLYRWLEDDPIFFTDLEDAKAAGRELRADEATTTAHEALIKRLRGFETIETITHRDANGNVTGSTERRRWVYPPPALILGALGRSAADAVEEPEPAGLPPIIYNVPPRPETPLDEYQNLN